MDSGQPGGDDIRLKPETRNLKPGILVLRFVSTGEAEEEEICPDYMNMLCMPGEEETCAKAVWGAVEAMQWDGLELVDMPGDSPLIDPKALSSLRRASRRFFGSVLQVSGFRFQVLAPPYSRGSCPTADLTGGFEAYLGRLSPNSRQQARRLIREGEAAGVTFEIAGPDQAEAVFDELIKLHQERWTSSGKPGVFSAPRFMAFHRRLVREWIPSGRAILARLSLAGEPVAVLYGFVNGKKFDFYQSGVRGKGQGVRGKGEEERGKGEEHGAGVVNSESWIVNRGENMKPSALPNQAQHSHDGLALSASRLPLTASPPLRSPGNLAHLLLMKALIERGVTTYDFLRGASSYKERLATGENRLVGMRVWRNTPRVVLYRATELVRRIGRKIGNLSRPPSSRNYGGPGRRPASSATANFAAAGRDR